MTQPCNQGERFAKAEAILATMAETLTEQKQLGIKTYEVLAVISLQGEQISSLIADTGTLKHDVEEAFKSLRRIDKRHNIEDGIDQENTRWRKAIFWLTEKLSVPVLMYFCFMLWISDKFNWFQKIVNLWKEFKG